ncbi:hypothetical protein OFC58_28675, partial [Escherichia coli]|nr:hypothetical protein [Escherichia coli]
MAFGDFVFCVMTKQCGWGKGRLGKTKNRAWGGSVFNIYQVRMTIIAALLGCKTKLIRQLLS